MSIIFLSLNCSQNNHDFRGLIHSLKLCGYLGEKKHVSVTGHPWIMIYFEHSVSLFVPSLAQCSTHTCFWGIFIFLSLCDMSTQVSLRCITFLQPSRPNLFMDFLMKAPTFKSGILGEHCMKPHRRSESRI